MATVQEQYQELCKLDPRIDDRIFIKSLNIVDRNKKEVISYLHGTSEPSPEFLKSWNNTIYPGYKNKLDNYPKISELYILIDNIIKDKDELYRKLLKQANGLEDVLELAMQLHEKADYYDMYDIIKGNRIIGNALVYAKSKYIYTELLKRDEKISDVNFLKLIGMNANVSIELRENNYTHVDRLTPNFDEFVVYASKINQVKPLSVDELKEFIQGIDDPTFKFYATKVFHRNSYFDFRNKKRSNVSKVALKKYYMFYYAYTIRQG